MKRFLALAAALLMLLPLTACSNEAGEKFIKAEFTADTAWFLTESGDLYAARTSVNGERQVTPSMKKAEISQISASGRMKASPCWTGSGM